jgi:hypothetical protein
MHTLSSEIVHTRQLNNGNHSVDARNDTTKIGSNEIAIVVCEALEFCSIDRVIQSQLTDALSPRAKS